MEGMSSSALQEQLNSAEDALMTALVRAAQACRAGVDAKERMHEVIGPMKSAVDAALPTNGEDGLVYCGVDRETYDHLILGTDAERAAFDKAEAELLEAKQQLLRLTTLAQSGLMAEQRARVGHVMTSTQETITLLWGITKEQQESVSSMHEILRSARSVSLEVDSSE